eukprot:468869-Amphidinium_carterae.1
MRVICHRHLGALPVLCRTMPQTGGAAGQGKCEADTTGDDQVELARAYHLYRIVARHFATQSQYSEVPTI